MTVASRPIALDDLARIDRAIANALAAIGVDWSAPVAPPSAASVARAPGLRRAALAFELSPLETDALLFALAPELDDRYAAAFAALHRNPALVRASVGLVARLLAEANALPLAAVQRALAADANVFVHRLAITLGDGPHATRSLALANGVWRRLVADTAPEALIDPTIAVDDLVLEPATLARVEHAIAAARSRPVAEVLVAVHGARGRTAVVHAIAHDLGWRCLPLVPGTAPIDRDAVVRDARWWDAAIVCELGCDVADVAAVVRDARVPVVAIVEPDRLRDVIAATPRPMLEVAIDELRAAGRTALWSRVAPELSRDAAAALASRYRFGPGRIAATVALARGRLTGGATLGPDHITAACRSGATGGMALVRRLEPPEHEPTLVVGPVTRRELDLLEAAARHGHRLFATGGLVALFAGPPGTGKTLAAQIIARTLALDLLRVDLSQVVNKYIGETEKHLDAVFREAEATGALLFFDEADALFGKRTEVRDAHDRYANLETAYLLQRLEEHRGVAILATNLKQNLDAAFLRRIQLVVDFEMPGPQERIGIWSHHLASYELASGIELALFGTFALSGGDIRNATRAAALLAACDGSPVTMRHLMLATWRELHKAGRLVNAGDFGVFRDEIVAYQKGVTGPASASSAPVSLPSR